MADEPNRQSVVVTDIHMPFLSMVVFMVKWAVAAIPALLILMVIGAFAWATILGLVFSAIAARKAAPVHVTDAPGASLPTPSKPAASPSSAETAYIEGVTVRGVSVEPTALGGKGVFGEVKNGGDRVLSKVEITIYCLDKNGTRIFEKTYHPVLVSGLSFGDSNAPLKPGYSRKFGVKLDDAPSEWSGKVEVRVTQITFGEGQGGT